MKVRSAVVFPDTVPSEQIFIPLVLVFEPLVYFQTVENDQIPPELIDPFIDTMTAATLCRIEVPAPLGHDRERFLQLIADIRYRRDEYAAQLSYVSLAALSTASRPASESKSSIVSNLLSSTGIQEKAADARVMELWQARLVLKLGEIHDADQEGLRRDLNNMNNKQETLLGELRQETDNLFSLTEELSSVSPVPDDMLRLRSKAWARMYVSGNVLLSRKEIFISRSKEAVELLGDTFERLTGQPVLRKISLPLPADYPEKGRLPEQLRQFKSEGAGLLENLYDQLEEVEGVSLEFDYEQWNTLVEKFFPEKRCGRVRLRLYSCPGVSAQQLFSDTFTSDKKSKFVAAAEVGISLGFLEQI